MPCEVLPEISFCLRRNGGEILSTAILVLWRRTNIPCQSNQNLKKIKKRLPRDAKCTAILAPSRWINPLAPQLDPEAILLAFGPNRR
jgi:hypothetical protein